MNSVWPLSPPSSAITCTPGTSTRRSSPLTPSAPPPIAGSSNTWVVFGLLFSFIGAVLPVWTYTRPINYISFYLVVLGMLGGFLGILVGRPQFSPAFEESAMFENMVNQDEMLNRVAGILCRP